MDSLHFPPMPTSTARAMESVLGSQKYLSCGGRRGRNTLQLFGAAPLRHSCTADTVLHFRYTLVTIFQYLESLSDAGAAEASRIRGDWKYALHLPLTFAGFKVSNLCAFRCTMHARQVASSTVFEDIIQWLRNQPQLLTDAGPCHHLGDEDIGAPSADSPAGMDV